MDNLKVATQAIIGAVSSPDVLKFQSAIEALLALKNDEIALVDKIVQRQAVLWFKQHDKPHIEFTIEYLRLIKLLQKVLFENFGTVLATDAIDLTVSSLFKSVNIQNYIYGIDDKPVYH